MLTIMAHQCLTTTLIIDSQETTTMLRWKLSVHPLMVTAPSRQTTTMRITLTEMGHIIPTTPQWAITRARLASNAPTHMQRAVVDRRQVREKVPLSSRRVAESLGAAMVNRVVMQTLSVTTSWVRPLARVLLVKSSLELMF